MKEKKKKQHHTTADFQAENSETSSNVQGSNIKLKCVPLHIDLTASFTHVIRYQNNDWPIYSPAKQEQQIYTQQAQE